jgi:DNA-binding winged helix-turn-helix (wHTH) protein
VHLSPKALDLLIVLIRERPRALSKAELHAHLWPNTFVSDASLAMLVAELRGALGETARHPHCVRTVHRHGYAFQAAGRENVDRRRAGQSGPAADSPPLGYWLITASHQVALSRGENLVGRDPASRVWLDSPSVSRHHARIVIDGDRATLEDLGSKNGTRAGDVRIKAATRLTDGEQLRFGSVRATFRTSSIDPTQSETSVS